MSFNDARARKANDKPVNESGRYVLYWMQAYRRLTHNHALDRAIAWARQLKRPLVVYEGLKLNAPWSSARYHQFLLEGMAANIAAAKALGINYWPFVETPGDTGRGLVRSLCANACLLVTDDYPQFIVPAQTRAIAATVDLSVEAVDGNGVVPLSLLGAPVSAAAHLRFRLHKLFPQAWENRAAAEPDFGGINAARKSPFKTWKPPKDLTAFVNGLPIDQGVPPVPGVVGGSAGVAPVLAAFVEGKLTRYADGRSQPNDPAGTAASRLSPYLRNGHVSVERVIAATLGDDWHPEHINPHTRNKEDFFCRDANANAFLDEVITWRDTGYHWSYHRAAAARASESPNKSWQEPGEAPSFNFGTFGFSPLPDDGTLAQVLPPWALVTLNKHAGDRREHLYELEEFEAGGTHDELWNAAQRELVATGRIHNYMRMLWGKKVLEWSRTPEAGYRVLEHLNNKYALDGRDPNSYSGVLWCFGLFDRPWPGDRDVFGSVRHMSSVSTAKKFKLAPYREYVSKLPAIAGVRGGGD